MVSGSAGGTGRSKTHVGACLMVYTIYNHDCACAYPLNIPNNRCLCCVSLFSLVTGALTECLLQRMPTPQAQVCQVHCIYRLAFVVSLLSLSLAVRSRSLLSVDHGPQNFHSMACDWFRHIFMREDSDAGSGERLSARLLPPVFGPQQTPAASSGARGDGRVVTLDTQLSLENNHSKEHIAVKQ